EEDSDAWVPPAEEEDRLEEAISSSNSCGVNLPRAVPEDMLSADTADMGELLHKLQAALMQAASALLKARIEDIDPTTEWKGLGFDSISLTTFAQVLNQSYRVELTPAIFFEYSNLHALTKHLLEQYPSHVREKFPPLSRTVAPDSIIEKRAAAD